MEESNDNGGSKKRVRVDSEDGCDSEAGDSKRIKDETKTDELPVDLVVSGIDSSEPVMMSNDILEILEDQYATTASDADIPDLDSVIRSFEEEILHPSPVLEPVDQPDLGYLLEASDDELGLPPAVSSPTKDQTKSQVPCYAYDSFGFENELPSYGPFEYGLGMETEGDGGNQFVNMGGLLEYSEESSDFSEFLWRPETESLPAVR